MNTEGSPVKPSIRQNLHQENHAPKSATAVESPIRIPRLLVSVRSVDEAARAVEGGADIVDVKEPSHGSLGMSSLETIASIAQWHRSSGISGGLKPTGVSSIPLSVALGEVVDWTSSPVIPHLPSGITFAKLGLSQLLNRRDWQNDWLAVRHEFEQRSSSRMKWVAVGYADSTSAAAPHVHDVLDAAIRTRCAGLLIDTWKKDNQCLLDGIDVASLISIAAECHAAGLFLAIAGKMTFEMLPLLRDLPVDVIGIRSAACSGFDRTSRLEVGRVRDFRNEMRQQAIN